MTNIRENNTTDIICEQDKLELFDEIMCKIQSKKNENCISNSRWSHNKIDYEI